MSIKKKKPSLQLHSLGQRPSGSLSGSPTPFFIVLLFHLLLRRSVRPKKNLLLRTQQTAQPQSFHSQSQKVILQAQNTRAHEEDQLCSFSRKMQISHSYISHEFVAHRQARICQGDERGCVQQAFVSELWLS